MNPTITVIHATRGRPKKAIETMMLWQARAMYPDGVEYILVSNNNDASRFDLKWDPAAMEFEVKQVEADSKYSAPAWNAGAAAARGNILIQGQDDVEPPQYWDATIRSLIWMNSRTVEGPFEQHNFPVFVGVGDGFRKGDHGQLCTTAIMNRAYTALEGCFLFPGYHSVFSDDDVTYRALRNHRDGKAIYVDAKDVVFMHRHHYHDKTVPWDDTYAHENSTEAYAQGGKLFAERNPHAATDGLKKW